MIAAQRSRHSAAPSPRSAPTPTTTAVGLLIWFSLSMSACGVLARVFASMTPVAYGPVSLPGPRPCGWPGRKRIVRFFNRPPGGRVGQDRIDGRAGLAIDEHDAWAFRREVLVAPRQQRNDRRGEVAAAHGRHIFMARRMFAVAAAFEKPGTRPGNSTVASACSGAMPRLFWNSSKRVIPCSASRMMSMLHHSPTRSRLRAIGQDILSKLLCCIDRT